jgi:hypothetical protein
MHMHIGLTVRTASATCIHTNAYIVTNVQRINIAKMQALSHTTHTYTHTHLKQLNPPVGEVQGVLRSVLSSPLGLPGTDLRSASLCYLSRFHARSFNTLTAAHTCTHTHTNTVTFTTVIDDAKRTCMKFN